MSEHRTVDPKLSFLAGWLLGRRRRRESGIGCLALLIGLFAGLTAFGSLVSAPLVWNTSRQTANLPRPATAELMAMPPGTELLTGARIPAELAVGEHGLALFRTEVYDTSSDDWRLADPVQARIGLFLLDDTPILVQFVSQVDLLNAQTVEVEDAESRMRYVGYLPGQAVALHGVWEGDCLFTAEQVYAGTIDDYLAYRARMPGMSLMMAFLCGGMAIVLLAVGGVLRFVGR